MRCPVRNMLTRYINRDLRPSDAQLIVWPGGIVASNAVTKPRLRARMNILPVDGR